MMLTLVLLSLSLYGRSNGNVFSALEAEGITEPEFLPGPSFAGTGTSLLGASPLGGALTGGPPKGAPPTGELLNRNGWTVTCDSSHVGNECEKVLDGDRNSFWHTEYRPASAPLPHAIIIDMKAVQIVSGISMLPRQVGNGNGLITGHIVSVSEDGMNWQLVAFGTWAADKTEKESEFEPVKAQYIRLVHTSEPKSQAYTSIAELNVYSAPSYTPPDPSLGIWGPTIDTPVIPVAASILPNGNVLMWSSWGKDTFVGGPLTLTATAIYNIKDGVVSQRTITNTKHDMFCPGISIDVNGRVIVTGGNSAPRTSIYDPASDIWISAPDMKIGRGYQSSCTCSSGRIFELGGSFTGDRAVDKNGEIYDINTNTWTLLPGCPVKPILTADRRGIYRSDNHAMLFAWKNDTVLQAGPSKAMNWYTVSGTGSHHGAGKRGNDEDAMCGVAVMFDATKGKILVAGGSHNYDDTPATTNGFVLTIRKPNHKVHVRKTSNKMFYPRIFVNSVVLPNGEVFINGGQTVGLPFREDGAHLTSEIYSPDDDLFRLAAWSIIPRVYHSLCLLMQDATVICGGGGLCGNCKTNHLNFQVYTPSYLLNADGSRATRPVITSVSRIVVKPGKRLYLVTDSEVVMASLVRIGSATHSTNTDQRRVPLDLNEYDEGVYFVELPADSGILLPGYWFLFVMNKDGVPSIGTTIQVTLP
uniref:Galactose oxidase-like protein n=1 Tax=Bemisia tabaci TaxID=7038 RepID=A0A7S5LIW4_BEMTA|nr:galactose oxidase-like protein [Bemisia tabaci]